MLLFSLLAGFLFMGILDIFFLSFLIHFTSASSKDPITPKCLGHGGNE